MFYGNHSICCQFTDDFSGTLSRNPVSFWPSAVLQRLRLATRGSSQMSAFSFCIVSPMCSTLFTFKKKITKPTCISGTVTAATPKAHVCSANRFTFSPKEAALISAVTKVRLYISEKLQTLSERIYWMLILFFKLFFLNMFSF